MGPVIIIRMHMTNVHDKNVVLVQENIRVGLKRGFSKMTKSRMEDDAIG